MTNNDRRANFLNELKISDYNSRFTEREQQQIQEYYEYLVKKYMGLSLKEIKENTNSTVEVRTRLDNKMMPNEIEELNKKARKEAIRKLKESIDKLEVAQQDQEEPKTDEWYLEKYIQYVQQPGGKSDTQLEFNDLLRKLIFLLYTEEQAAIIKTEARKGKTLKDILSKLKDDVQYL